MKTFVKNQMLDNSINLQECKIIEIREKDVIITSINNNLKVSVNKNRIVHI